MAKAVHVLFLPAEADETQVADCTVIVVDLLRASTTLTFALHHGARGVIPVASPEKAKELRDSIGRDSALLCGERRGQMIEGFDLGNSPREYTPDVVAQKTLVYASSNGSVAMIAGGAAARMAVGALVNLDAVIEWATPDGESPRDCVVLCAGKLGRFSSEDAACAGLISAHLVRRGYRLGNDAAQVAHDLGSRAGDDWLAFLRTTDHGRYLIELGYEPDLEIAARLNTLAVVPVWQGGRIGLHEDQGGL